MIILWVSRYTLFQNIWMLFEKQILKMVSLSSELQYLLDTWDIQCCHQGYRSLLHTGRGRSYDPDNRSLGHMMCSCLRQLDCMYLADMTRLLSQSLFTSRYLAHMTRLLSQSLFTCRYLAHIDNHCLPAGTWHTWLGSQFNHCLPVGTYIMLVYRCTYVISILSSSLFFTLSHNIRNHLDSSNDKRKTANIFTIISKKVFLHYPDYCIFQYFTV